MDPCDSLPSQPNLMVKLQANERHCLKNKVDFSLKNKPRGCSLTHPNALTYGRVYLLIYKGALQGRVVNLLEFNREMT